MVTPNKTTYLGYLGVVHSNLLHLLLQDSVPVFGDVIHPRLALWEKRNTGKWHQATTSKPSVKSGRKLQQKKDKPEQRSSAPPQIVFSPHFVVSPWLSCVTAFPFVPSFSPLFVGGVPVPYEAVPLSSSYGNVFRHRGAEVGWGGLGWVMGVWLSRFTKGLRNGKGVSWGRAKSLLRP